MPIAIDVHFPGNHRRNSFAEFAFRAANENPRKKLATSWTGNTMLNTRMMAPTDAIAKPKIMTVRMDFLSAQAPPTRPNKKPVR